MTNAADRARPLPDVDATSALVIDLVRTGEASTRPELMERTGLGRAVVHLRVEQALDIGVLADADLGPSTGGRAPRRLRFRADAGCIYAAVIGTGHLSVAVTDLAGAVVGQVEEVRRDDGDPVAALQHAAHLLDGLVAQNGVTAPLWGIGLGMPGPVDFASGRSVGGQVLPAWDGFDIRGWFAARYEAPAWVDNDLNLMVLGNRTQNGGPEDDVILIKVSSGIGAGLVSGGRVHRGRNGSAGDIGHTAVASTGSTTCRCGQVNCLEAMAGGWALARDATTSAGSSAFLTNRLETNGDISPEDVRDGARRADPICLELVNRSATLVGETLATLVSFYNPAIVYIGGVIPDAGDMFLVGVRRAVYQRSLPLATRDLRILPTTLDRGDGIRAASTMVIERIFDLTAMERWLEHGSPVGMTESLGT